MIVCQGKRDILDDRKVSCAQIVVSPETRNQDKIVTRALPLRYLWLKIVGIDMFGT